MPVNISGGVKKSSTTRGCFVFPFFRFGSHPRRVLRRSKSVSTFFSDDLETARRSKSVRLTRYSLLSPTEIGEEYNEGNHNSSSLHPSEMSVTEEPFISKHTIDGTVTHIKKKVSFDEKIQYTVHQATTTANDPTKQVFEKRESKQKSVICELIESEKKYIQDLGRVSEYAKIMSDSEPAGYTIPIPIGLQKTSELYAYWQSAFANIGLICEWHENTCLPALEQCIDRPQKLCDVFKKLDSIFFLYEIHLHKKEFLKLLFTKYKHYFEEIRLYLGHDLYISSIEIKPLERIIHYELLLKKALMCAEKSNLFNQLEALQTAIDGVSKFTLDINNVMILDKLHNFNGDIKLQGELLLHGSLICAERPIDDDVTKEVYRDLHGFLFERSLIFTDDILARKKKLHESSYIYQHHIPLGQLSELAVLEDSCDGSFVIRFDSGPSQRQYVCRPVGNEMRFKWISTLRNILQNNYEFVDAIMNPLENKDKKHGV